jgi:hypothetical protein
MCVYMCVSMYIPRRTVGLVVDRGAALLEGDRGGEEQGVDGVQQGLAPVCVYVCVYVCVSVYVCVCVCMCV